MPETIPPIRRTNGNNKLLKVKKAGSYFLWLCLLCSYNPCLATITVDSVKVTPSTCPNNGTATLYAHSTSDSAVFLFNVTAGPVTYPQQHDSTFKSLYPGSYVAWVHDVNSYDSIEISFTITGNYKPLLLSDTVIPPFCKSDVNGVIIVPVSPSTGLAPYTWQITSPYTGTIQTIDTISGLPTGTYVVNVTDACHTVKTKGVVVDSGGVNIVPASYSTYFLSCNKLMISLDFYMNSGKANLPLKLIVTTGGGITIKTRIPQKIGGISQPVYSISDTITGVNYGDYLSVCIVDTCADTTCNLLAPYDTVSHFKFWPVFQVQAVGNCLASSSATVIFDNRYPTTTIYGTTLPLTITVKNLSTNVVVDSAIESSSYNPTLHPESDTTNYLITVKDDCGNMFTGVIQWPDTSSISVQGYQSNRTCLDSTYGYEVSSSGLSLGATFTFLSGPPSAHSSKLGYTYYDTIIYPVTFTLNANPFAFANLPKGHFTYNIFDSCGYTKNDSFDITSVVDYELNPQVEYYCGGLSTIIIPYGGEDAYFMYDSLMNIALSPVLTARGQEFQNLSEGLYKYRAIYTLFGVLGTEYLAGDDQCWVRTIYINIPQRNDSTLRATDIATCNGVVYMHVEVDSNNGMPPFKYEIIGGPETFPPQDSANFITQTFGTYVLGVIDSCGNVDIRQITVDTGRFTPVTKTGGWCQGSGAKLMDVSSPYYTYVWHTPNGTFFTGDTLNINPFMPSDTGLYLIDKIIDINGCRDSVHSSYYLAFKDTFQQTVSICSGDTLFVGANAHAVAGIYFDTLSGAYGCDSIEVTTLSMLSSTQAAIVPANPPQCHQSAITLTASGGTTYRWSPGNHISAGITVNPLIKTVYTVTVSDSTLCSATASVTVYPPGDTIVNLTQNKTIICPTDSANICATAGFNIYTWNNGDSVQCISTSVPGNYSVTATNNVGCTVASGTATVAAFTATPVTVSVNGDTLKSYHDVSYQWYFNNAPIPGDTSFSIVALQTGSYAVQVTDSNGCVYFSNPIEIAGIKVSTGEQGYLEVYPNPTTTGSWQVSVSDGLIGSLCEVFDAEGRTVYRNHLISAKSTVSIQILSGIYLMKISSALGAYNVKLVQF